MALHDKEVYRTLGCGMTGLSITIKRGSDFSAMPTRDELKEGNV